MEIVSTDRLKDKLGSHNGPLLLDVQPRDHFEAAHIPGSVHGDVDSERFATEVLELVGGDKAAPLIVYCESESCSASARAASKLMGAGFTGVAVYVGGIKEWRAARQSITGKSGSGAREGRERSDGAESNSDS